MVQSRRVFLGGGDGGGQVTRARKGVGDDPGARADRQGVLAGQRGGHAPIGGDVGQARVAGLEQEPGRDMVSVGGERAGAETVITGKAVTGGTELAERVGEAADEFVVPAGLIVLAGPGDAEGQAGEVGWRRGRFGGGAGEHQDERFDAGRRVPVQRYGPCR